MEGTARISSVEALSEFRVALIKFKSEAAAALLGTESELQRTIMWLRHDQSAYWQRQIRHRQELLTRAKSDMFRKQVAQDAEIRVSVDQKKAVEKAKRDLEHAEEKVRTVRRWIALLDKEHVLYRGECQGLSGMLEADIPAILKRLDGMIGSIEAYMTVTGSGGDAAARETEQATPPAPPASDSSSPASETSTNPGAHP